MAIFEHFLKGLALLLGNFFEHIFSTRKCQKMLKIKKKQHSKVFCFILRHFGTFFGAKKKCSKMAIFEHFLKGLALDLGNFFAHIFSTKKRPKND